MGVMALRRGGRHRDGDRLTISQAAALWHVARSTVYFWIDAGLLTCFDTRKPNGAETARRVDVFAARVLRLRQLRTFGISEADIARAGRGRPWPKASRQVARFSLDDVEAIRTLAGTEGSARAGKRHPSGIMRINLESEIERERAWVASGADPLELDDDYFDCEEPPVLKTPPGVFLYECAAPVESEPGARYVRRSAGWDYVDGTLLWFEEDDRFAILTPGERLRPEWVRSNHLYRTAHRIWLCVWTRRSRRRRMS